MDQNTKRGNFITELRKKKKLTQAKLGNLIGVSNRAVSNWENGTRLPAPEELAKLASSLGVSMEEILSGTRAPVIDGGELDALSRLDHVYKYYNDDSRVVIGLKDINLTFRIGEKIAITGVSGSGKTTLLNMIGGLDCFEGGEIYINQEGMSRYDEIEYENYRKKYISYIFQDYGIIESYSIIDNLILIRSLMGDSEKEAKRKAIDMLKSIGLAQFRNKRAAKLSGGQKQKLSLARALIKDSPITLGDEITANLDSKSAREVLKLLFSRCKDKLVILVTHNFGEVEEYVTRRISMKDAKVISDDHYAPCPNEQYLDRAPKEPSKAKMGLLVAGKQAKKEPAWDSRLGHNRPVSRRNYPRRILCF